MSSPQAYVGLRASSSYRPFFTSSANRTFQATTHRHIARTITHAITRRQITAMPIGVPKVPYRSPKDNMWQWVDIWNVLYRERIIFLSKAVTEELGNQLIATMLYLDSENKKDLNIYINCSGGEVVPCLGIHDTMRYIKSDVSTIGLGGCMGMAGYILAMGQKGKRYALKNTRIMLHHPAGAARGMASDIHREARELLKIRDHMDAMIAEQSGQNVDKVAYDLRRNLYMTTEDAKQYGIIDTIVKPLKGKMKVVERTANV